MNACDTDVFLTMLLDGSLLFFCYAIWRKWKE